MCIFLVVPTIHIIFMIISSFISIVVPIVLALVLFKKKKQKMSTFLIGALTFIVFALFLEAYLNNWILSSSGPFGLTIIQNTWLYGLYAGLAAGIFEETGRFVAFKYALKKENNPDTSLMAGVGHGGIEAMILVGLQLGMIAYYALQFNSNPSQSMLTPDIVTILDEISVTPSIQLLIAGIERMFSLILHISFSVLVFAGVRIKGKAYLIGIAVLLHFLVDFSAVVLMGFSNVFVSEAVVLIITLGTAFLAYKVYKNMVEKRKSEEEIPIQPFVLKEDQ